VVFRATPAGEPNRDFIKRIVALPGETVGIHNEGVYVDGRRLPENYPHRPIGYTFPTRTVPKNSYFVLGDNRNNSDDSHMWRTTWLPREDIIGRAWVTYWPIEDLRVVQTLSRFPMVY